MLTLNINQQSILASSGKRVTWLFIVTDINSNTYNWSTKNGTLPGITFTHKIADFQCVEMSSPMSGQGLQVPTTTEFSILNADGALTDSNFKGGQAIVRVYVGDRWGYELIRGWRFWIKTAKKFRRKIQCSCVDYIQKYIKGSYPTYPLVSDLVFSMDTYTKSGGKKDNVCPPVPIGLAYVPLRFKYFDGDGAYYILGPSDKTYTVTKVRAPRSKSNSEWSSAYSGAPLLYSGELYNSGGANFQQFTKTDRFGNDWTVVKPIIGDADNDGVDDGMGVWSDGGNMCDMPAQLNRSDTIDKTSPSDSISFVMQDMGMPSTHLDAALFASAKATFTGWTLEWNGAFWYKEDRDKILAKLLNQCHSTFRLGETIGLRPLSKVSQATISKTTGVIKGTFKRTEKDPSEYDSGYVTWRKAGEAQDEFIELLIPLDAAAANAQSDILECPFVQDSVAVQKIKKLRLERDLLVDGDVTFMSKGMLLAFECDDTLTVDEADYGGTYSMAVEKMKVNKGLTIEFQGPSFSRALSDWGDLDPDPIYVSGTDTTIPWSPPLTGPLSDREEGKIYNIFGMAMDTPWITVGPNARDAMFTSLEAAVAFFTTSPAEHGRIAVLNNNSDYAEPSAAITIPNKSLDIEGQTRDGVVQRSKTGENLLYYHNLTKQFSLKNFSIRSMNNGSYSKMILVDGSSNSGKYKFEKICHQLADSGIAGSGTGDYGFYISGGSMGKCKIAECKSMGGSFPIYVYDYYSDIEIISNEIYEALAWAIFQDSLTAFIIGNYLKDLYAEGIYSKSYNRNTGVIGKSVVQQNKIFFKESTDVAATLVGLEVFARLGNLDGNLINIKPTKTSITSIYGLSLFASIAGQLIKQVATDNNTIEIVLPASANPDIYGLYAVGFDGGFVDDCGFVGNQVKIDAAGTGNHYGAYIDGGDRTKIISNGFDLTNSHAHDKGLYLGYDETDPDQAHNTFTGCGTDVEDHATYSA